MSTLAIPPPPALLRVESVIVVIAPANVKKRTVVTTNVLENLSKEENFSQKALRGFCFKSESVPQPVAIIFGILNNSVVYPTACQVELSLVMFDWLLFH